MTPEPDSDLDRLTKKLIRDQKDREQKSIEEHKGQKEQEDQEKKGSARVTEGLEDLANAQKIGEGVMAEGPRRDQQPAENLANLEEE